MTRVLVLGAYGMLGSSLCRRLSINGHTVFRQGRGVDAEFTIDPTDIDAMTDLIMGQGLDAIVNLIAATNVDLCEEDVQVAYRANVQVVETLTCAIRRNGNPSPHLIQISTDQVYNGLGPHREDRVAPCNVYALSKLAGELTAFKIGATVLRTNFFGRSQCIGRTSLSDWIIASLRAGQRITVFDDVLFSALHIETLCSAIELTLGSRQAGIFNLGCQDGCSKAHLAHGLADILGLDSNLLAVGSAQDMKLRARRPSDMRMDSTQFEHTFFFAAPTFESQIDLAAQEYFDE